MIYLSSMLKSLSSFEYARIFVDAFKCEVTQSLTSTRAVRNLNTFHQNGLCRAEYSSHLPALPTSKLLTVAGSMVSSYTSTTCNRMLHTSSHQNQNNSSKPVILYIQNPIRWLMNKLDFGMLRRAWDPEFQEKDFKEGAKLAVSSITQLLSSSKYDDLSDLLTSPALNSLRHDVETKWSDGQRRNVNLSKEDIRVVLPQRVRFQSIAEKRLCDIDMVFLALKQTIFDGGTATIFIEIKARFQRDYSFDEVPDWTISMFKVTRFNVIPR